MTRMNEASARLDAALGRLENALDGLMERAGEPGARQRELEALLADRARLAGELDEALARESELQGLADEASDALGAAIEEVRAALERGNGADGQG